MQTTEPITVKSAQKKYFCDWCGEHIIKGGPYKKWFTYGENVTARMHLECYHASGRAELYDEELPPVGIYRRGCWCGENKEHCNCG